LVQKSPGSSPGGTTRLMTKPFVIQLDSKRFFCAVVGMVVGFVIKTALPHFLLHLAFSYFQDVGRENRQMNSSSRYFTW
jgi:hypothetical protein